MDFQCSRGCGWLQRQPANWICRKFAHRVVSADETVLGPEMNEPAQFLMFLPLVAWDRRGELEGRLAEHWEHSPDYRTWIIRLRNSVRWHDGVPVTAHDIKFNLDLRSHPDVL